MGNRRIFCRTSYNQTGFPLAFFFIRYRHWLLLSIGILIVLIITAMFSGKQPDPIPSYRELGELRVATRLDALSYITDDEGTPSGFEHDLLIEFGKQLNIPVRFIVYPDSRNALFSVLEGQTHLAAAGLSKNDRLPFIWSAPLHEREFVLIGNTGNIRPIQNEQELEGHTITVRRGTLSADTLRHIQTRYPDIQIRQVTTGSDQTLLEQLAAGELDLVATDDLQYAIASRFYPALAVIYTLPENAQIAWALPSPPDPELLHQLNEFIIQAHQNKLISRTSDRYFGHVNRLDENDITLFLNRIRERLPALRQYFYDAQVETGIDWRYLAALAYQESHWDASATSRTGVRGMMMLTADTADRLGVTNRLDARQSIMGGARYITMLKNNLPDDIPEPERLWMATAAYNLGMRHVQGARSIATSTGKDNTSWLDMKSILPLLSRPEYANRFKSGAARGGEAVIMTENIRNFYDILSQLERPYSASITDGRPRLGLPPSTPITA